jgi:glycosyltransferase involved in cell wall biosynthesis
LNPIPQSKSRRVLFVDHVDRILGGAEINLIELIEEALRHSDWEIAVACRRQSMLGDALDELGVRQFEYGFSDGLNKLRFAEKRFPWFRLGGGLRSLIGARFTLSRIGKQFQPGAIVSCTNKDHIVATATFPTGRIQRIWWVNDLITADFFSFSTRWAFRKFLNFGPGLIAVSNCVKEALLELGAKSEQVQVIHNGIPLERYRRVRRGFLRERLGIPAGEPLYGNIGRLTPWKGQRFFVDLAKEWVKQRLPGHFILIGAAFNEDQKYEDELRRLVRTRALEGRFHFVGATKEIAAALSDLDALVHTSIKPEPFGRVLIEAMAVGTPVIAPNAGGPREIITDDLNGLLANPGDLLDYIRKLRLVSTDAEFRQRLVNRARQTVEERFTIQRTARWFDEILQ